ncbi:hypothetical protein BaRGS_00017097 [Batillaria attramentaria]|uniref:Uncharacterized protein n=1 Tax=Batillaria attramentaria TaxID=370345 RepID=A0ABD0KWX2_9CAEN
MSLEVTKTPGMLWPNWCPASHVKGGARQRGDVFAREGDRRLEREKRQERGEVTQSGAVEVLLVQYAHVELVRSLA